MLEEVQIQIEDVECMSSVLRSCDDDASLDAFGKDRKDDV